MNKSLYKYIAFLLYFLISCNVFAATYGKFTTDKISYTRAEQYVAVSFLVEDIAIGQTVQVAPTVYYPNHSLAFTEEVMSITRGNADVDYAVFTFKILIQDNKLSTQLGSWFIGGEVNLGNGWLEVEQTKFFMTHESGQPKQKYTLAISEDIINSRGDKVTNTPGFNVSYKPLIYQNANAETYLLSSFQEQDILIFSLIPDYYYHPLHYEFYVIYDEVHQAGQPKSGSSNNEFWNGTSSFFESSMFYLYPGKWELLTVLRLDSGETDVQSVSVNIVDDIAPEIEITSHEDSYLTDDDWIILEGIGVENSFQGFVGINWQVQWTNEDGKQYTEFGNAGGHQTLNSVTRKMNISWDAGIPLHKGENYITVTGYDIAGNEDEAKITIIKNNPPQLENLTASEVISDKETKTKVVTISLKATDKDSNLKEVNIDWKEGETQTIPIQGSEQTITLSHTYDISERVLWLAKAKDSLDEESNLVIGMIAPLDDCHPEHVADPIDIATGAQFLRESLLQVNGTLPLNFTIDYNSMLMRKGQFGRSWGDTHYGSYLEFIDENQIAVHWTTNRYHYFNDVGNGLYQSTDFSCNFDTLEQEDNGWLLTRKTGQVYRFNAQGQLIQRGNKQGQFVELTYNELNQLVKVTEPSGRYLQYHYTDGLVTAVTDNSGRQVSFQYDSDTNLTQITDTLGQTTNYVHNELGQIVRATDTNGQQVFRNVFDETTHLTIAQYDGHDDKAIQLSYSDDLVTTVTYRNGQQKIYTFDGAYKLVSLRDELGQTKQYAYNEQGKRTQITNAKGETKYFAYDERGNLTSITDEAGAVTSLQYDANDNLTRVINAGNQTVELSYDTQNRLISYRNAIGETANYEYNAQGQLTAYTSAAGNTTRLTYENGLVSQITQPEGEVQAVEYDAIGRMVAIIDAEGYTTRIAYDAKGRVISLTDALNQVRQFAYDYRDNIIQVTDANGNVTRREYDASGRLVAQIDALNNTTRYEYDDNDRLTRIIAPNGVGTEFNYNAKGQLVQVIDALNHSRQIAYDELGNVVSQVDSVGEQVAKFNYDVRDNVTVSEDALGHQTHWRYDELSRVIETVNPLGNATEFSYDGLNRLVSSVDALNGISSQSFDAEGSTSSLTDPNQNQTQFTYDRNGRLIAEIVATGHAVSYEYNARDLLSKVTNGRGQQRHLEYDAVGRLIRLTDVDGTIEYTYDANGNVLTVKDHQGTITRTYDALNRVTSYIDAHGNTLGYEYDKMGNLTRLTYPDGKQVQYAYDVNNRLVMVKDWSNRVTQYAYDANGRLIQTIRLNGTQQTRGYDAKGQLLTQTELDAQGQTLLRYQFSYDAVGNIVAETVEPNLATLLPANTEMSYGLANHLATVDQQNITLDADGNMVEGLLQGELTQFSFDSRNRLTQAGNTQYQYDAENQRIAVNDTQYVINSQPNLSQALVRTKGNGEVTYYVYGLGLIGEERAGNYFSYHFDYRGSTIAITNITGQLLDSVQYSPFGIVLSQPTFDTPFLFNGLYGVMTDGNRLNYMRARYYSAEIRRFVNQDVLLGSIADGQSLNRFAYVMGDPIKYNDPFGLDRGCGPGYRSVPDPSQPHVSFCEEDGSDPFEKICVTPECLARDAARCGNDDGARPYIGIGGYVDTHYILFGVNSELAIISEGERTCVFKTDCFSLGPGFFMGSGGTFPFGVAIGDIEESLAGSSAGFSFDIGYCLQSYGTNVSTGYNENGITSVGSSKGAGRLGGGCGVSFTLDLCSTKVLSCNKP